MPDLKPQQMTVLIDTREQQPFSFPHMLTDKTALKTGDYTVRGLEHIVAIERKGFEDLVNCIGFDRDRFEDQLRRLKAFPVKAVVIEGSWEELEAGNYRSKLNPKSAIGSCLGWIAAGIPFVFAGTRERAETMTARLLYIVARREYAKAHQVVKSFRDF